MPEEFEPPEFEPPEFDGVPPDVGAPLDDGVLPPENASPSFVPPTDDDGGLVVPAFGVVLAAPVPLAPAGPDPPALRVAVEPLPAVSSLPLPPDPPERSAWVVSATEDVFGAAPVVPVGTAEPVVANEREPPPPPPANALTPASFVRVDLFCSNDVEDTLVSDKSSLTKSSCLATAAAFERVIASASVKGVRCGVVLPVRTLMLSIAGTLELMADVKSSLT